MQSLLGFLALSAAPLTSGTYKAEGLGRKPFTILDMSSPTMCKRLAIFRARVFSPQEGDHPRE